MPIIGLRPFGREDFGRLIAWSHSPEFLLQWAGPLFTYPLDQTQLERYLRSSRECPPQRKIFKIVDGDTRDTHGTVGHIELNNIDMRHLSATVSRVLIGEPSQRGKGLGAEAMRCLLEIGFGEMGLHRIDLCVFDFNRPAIRCYEKVGFRIEGHLRDTRKVGHGFWNTYVMSLLDTEWLARGGGEP
jgi:RimJ/RimL family protein N-acetyltransferase